MCNHYGTELLDLCKASHLRLINGRFGEDKGVGSFTCYTSRGQSTVDYHILSETLLGRIQNFTMEPPSDISDHCPLVTTLSESNYSIHEFVKLLNASTFLEDMMLREAPSDAQLVPPLPTRYLWTPRSEKEVSAALTSSAFNRSLACLNSEVQSISVDETLPNLLAYSRKRYQNVRLLSRRGNMHLISFQEIPGLTVSARN